VPEYTFIATKRLFYTQGKVSTRPFCGEEGLVTYNFENKARERRMLMMGEFQLVGVEKNPIPLSRILSPCRNLLGKHGEKNLSKPK
jgi:hypothetical protein